jgi:tRNA pseudouridine13 synthase
MRYASESIPACPGLFKAAEADFCVDELPLYPFSGEGDHTLVRIEKAGITTFEAIRRLCHALEFRERDVGYAGLKDARGVTRQWLSFEHAPPERFLNLELPRLRVLETTRHGNKLKRGHLAGNAFKVSLRDVAPENVPHAEATLALLARRGVPNWYDAQRFGTRGDNARAGEAILRGDWATYFACLLGGARDERDSARAAYDAGDLAAALEAWPRNANQERGALKAVMEYGATEKALRRVPQKLKLLQVSAVQSELFNRVLDARFEAYDRVWEGDLCRKENGADFLVSDAAADQVRADAFEISPTGPIFGYRMMQPGGRMAEIERAALADAGLSAEMFDAGRGLSQKGDRRPLRFSLTGTQVHYDAQERALRLSFTLPKGCYATVVLREITKGGAR